MSLGTLPVGYLTNTMASAFTEIYNVVVVRAYKKNDQWTEKFMIEGASLEILKASQLCKQMAMKGDDVNRAFVVKMELDKEELFAMSEDDAIIVYNSEGNRLDDPSEVV
jgi:hypothetical protein